MKTQKLVWCEGAIGFAHCGNVFRARVLDDAEMHRPAREGYVWVERVTTAVDYEVERDENGNEVPWRVEWPIEIGNGDRGDKNKFLTGF
tara:strand:+ start:99 stop:365 length:267 start_codon:yes stop_codon:yes gene_type:complete